MPPRRRVWVTQRAALVVSSRYHPLVFATAAAVPCLGLYRDAYTRIKLQGALAHVGMEAWCLSAAAAEEGRAADGAPPSVGRARGARAAMTRARGPLAAAGGAALATAAGAARLAAGAGRPPAATLARLAGRTGPAGRRGAPALALERQASDAETWRWRAIVETSRTIGRPRRPGRPGERRDGRDHRGESTSVDRSAMDRLRPRRLPAPRQGAGAGRSWTPCGSGPTTSRSAT